MITKKLIRETIAKNYILRDFVSINFTEVKNDNVSKRMNCYICYQHRVVELDIVYNAKDRKTSVYWTVEGYIYQLTAEYLTAFVRELEMKANA